MWSLQWHVDNFKNDYISSSNNLLEVYWIKGTFLRLIIMSELNYLILLTKYSQKSLMKILVFPKFFQIHIGALFSGSLAACGNYWIGEWWIWSGIWHCRRKSNWCDSKNHSSWRSGWSGKLLQQVFHAVLLNNMASSFTLSVRKNKLWPSIMSEKLNYNLLFC